MEFEKRELEYAKTRNNLVRTVLKNGDVNCEDILEQLSGLQSSIFFEENTASSVICFGLPA